MAQKEELGHIWNLSCDGEVEDLKIMTICILPWADGGCMRIGGGFCSSSGGARLGDSPRIRMMATEPVIAVEKGHRMGMDGRDFLTWMSEQGELHIKGEFLQDV